MNGGGAVSGASGLDGVPKQAGDRQIALLADHRRLQAAWLSGTRAMGRHQPGSDRDLCLEGPPLRHHDRLRLMAAVDDPLLPWRVDLVWRHALTADSEAHVQRACLCLLSRP